MKFKVTQIFRDRFDNLDDDVKIIEANNKEEAEKIYWEKNFRIKGFYKLTVEPMEENNEFKRLQELAGVEEGKSDVFYSNKNKIKDILTNTELIDLINYFSEYYKRDDLGKNFKITGTKLNNILNSIDNYQPYR